jgi:ribulose-5-phosphate 4-epimerase/fuculose-1-phosphate aldolase
LAVGGSVEAAVGWFVLAEGVAEVHVKAPAGKAISDEAAEVAAQSMAPAPTGWRMFQWLLRSLAIDPEIVGRDIVG